MQDIKAEQLEGVIQSQHGGKARFLRTVQVIGKHGNPAFWDGAVHIFELKDHPDAKKAYAWTAPIDSNGGVRLFAVLHQGRVTSPLEAVKAAASAIQGTMGRPTKKRARQAGAKA